MAYDPQLDDHDYQKQDKKFGCLHMIVIAFIVFSLIGTSAIGAISFYREFQERNKRTAEFDLAAVAPAATATAFETKIDDTEVERPIYTPEPIDTGDSIAAVEANNQIRQNRIVLVNNDGHIETIAPGGHDRHILTEDSKDYDFPTWSPDGQHIAVLGSRRTGAGIFLLADSDTPEEQVELYYSQNRSPFYLYWAPDSRQLSFLANNPGDGLGLNILDIAKPDTESRLVAAGSPIYWNWTADSRELLLNSGLVDDRLLGLIDNQGEISAPPIQTPGQFQTPGISSSENFWAYSQINDDGQQFLIIDNQATGEQIKENHEGSLALSWSPNADKLAFITGPRENPHSFWGALKTIDASTGEIEQLTSNLVLAFFWSPDGQKIAAITLPTKNIFDQAQEANAQKSRVLSKLNSNIQPVQLPREMILTIFDVQTGEGLTLASLTPTFTFLNQFLLYFDQYTLSHTLWSPSSDALVIPMRVDGRNQIMVVSADSGRMQAISNGSIAFWSHQ